MQIALHTDHGQVLNTSIRTSDADGVVASGVDHVWGLVLSNQSAAALRVGVREAASPTTNAFEIELASKATVTIPFPRPLTWTGVYIEILSGAGGYSATAFHF
jgi:hypothetical protein